ncbi:MAG: polysaccharide deacetylase [Alphaproteobacteria bacterium]|nr:polysaccharide deacetylase [Alphaproteobacteria bacterium]
MNLKIKLTSLMARKLPVKTARLAGHRPVASITFDDFPKNAWTLGGPILAKHGVRGTYYTAGGFCGRTVDGTVFYDREDLKALVAAGHELGCHGYGHQPTPTLTTDQLKADAERNQEFLRGFTGGVAPVSYAFPFGRVSPRTKRFYAPRFTNVRGVHPGVNVGRVDLAQLNTISLESRCWEPEKIEAAIQRVLHDHGWLVLYTHDVSDTPSPYGSTPQMLDWALGKVAAARIEVLPMREALSVALGA